MPERTTHLRSANELGVANVRDIVERVFGIEGTERGREYDILCPDPGHQDTNPSASVNLTTGYWHCFSCGRGGDLLGLGSRALEKHRDDIEEMLKPTSVESLQLILRNRMQPLRRRTRVALTVPAPREYEDLPVRNELRARGFDRRTLARWNVRYVPEETLEGQKGPFTIRDSIGIPIMDRDQHVVAWCYRRTRRSPEWQPKYLYTYGAELSEIWFGLQHHAEARDIVVVEGALDAMWCDQAGVPALALLGASMGERKLIWLTRYHSVTLLGDMDSGGVAAVQRIGQAIGSLVPLKVARYSSWMHATDPQELHPVDLEIVVAAAVPWLLYEMRRR